MDGFKPGGVISYHCPEDGQEIIRLHAEITKRDNQIATLETSLKRLAMDCAMLEAELRRAEGR